MTAPDPTPGTRHVTDVTTVACAHCGRPITIVDRPGPVPRYCRRSCRQRAYEARTANAATVAVDHHFDAGLSRSGRVHALHPNFPAAHADGTRPTLCGTTARPSRRQFTASPSSCARCIRAAANRLVVDHVPASVLTALIAAAHQACITLDGSHDETVSQLATALFKIEQHLSRDNPPNSPTNHTR